MSLFWGLRGAERIVIEYTIPRIAKDCDDVARVSDFGIAIGHQLLDNWGIFQDSGAILSIAWQSFPVLQPCRDSIGL